MANASRPVVNAQIVPANIFEAFGSRHDLIVGQMYTGAGTAVSGELYTDVQAMTNAEINAAFGIDTELTQRINDYLFASDRQVKLSVIPIDDAGAATAATADITFTGTSATEAGTFTISIVDEYKYTVEVPVVVGDTPSTVGVKADAAIAALLSCPVGSSETTGVVTLTAKNKGPVGNTYGLKVVQSGAGGLGVGIDPFTGGATNPDVTGILDVLGEMRATGIGWPEAWDSTLELAVVNDYLTTRFDVENQIQDGVAFVGKTDTYANNKAFAEGYNSQVLVFGGNALIAETLHKGPVILKPADCVMATFMAVRSKRLTEGALISGDIVARNGTLDNVGGPALASLPYFNTVDRRAKVPTEIGLTYTQAEEYDLADAGFTVYGINAAGNAIIFRDVVTTYKTDTAGNPNASFKYLNYVDTGSTCREILFNSAKSRFAQSRLTPGALEFGRNMENAGSIKSHYLEVLRELGTLALLASGPEAELEMSDGTIVTIDTANRSASVAGPIILVTQLGTITYTLQFQFASATA